MSEDRSADAAGNPADEAAGNPRDEAYTSGVEPETGRPRSSDVIGGLRSPIDDVASERAGTMSPESPADNDARTGKKLSQWGASSRRRSYWKNRYY